MEYARAVLIRQGDARSIDIDRRLACSLAAIAGALNTAAFAEVGFFAANMTGNVSTLSAHIGIGRWLSGVFYLLIVAMFITGAALSTQLINAGRRRAIGGIYAFSILSEGVLMGALGCTLLALPPGQRGPVLVLGLSFLMGLQNATVTHISDARVRTTHVSGMVTDIGIELSVLFDIACGRERQVDAAATRSKFRLHSQTVLCFLAGGVAGVVVYDAIGDLILFVAGVLLVAIALAGLLRVGSAWGSRAPRSP